MKILKKYGRKSRVLHFLFYWKAALEVGFDNRIRRAIFGSSRYDLASKKSNILPTKPKQILLDGKVEKWESFTVCKDAIVDFGRCRPDNKSNPRNRIFEEGFIRIGDRLSPAVKGFFPKLDFDRWRRTSEPSPAADEFAPGKATFFIKRYVNNIALATRSLLQCHYIFKRLNVPEDDRLLLLLEHARLPGAAQDLLDKPFNPSQIGSGTFLFRRLVFFAPAGTSNFYRRVLPWLSSDITASFLRRVLTAFDIEPRVRVTEVKRITLISRQDWQDPLLKKMASPGRKISNEDEIIDALCERFPRVEVNKVSMEHLSMKEQIDLMHHTDVLIGMHGAGLGFCSMLSPNAGVLELLPAHFMYCHWVNTVYTLLVNNRCHYQRWINLNPRREFASEAYTHRWLEMQSQMRLFQPRRDFTEVPPAVVIRKVEVLCKQIRKAANSSH